MQRLILLPATMMTSLTNLIGNLENDKAGSLSAARDNIWNEVSKHERNLIFYLDYPYDNWIRVYNLRFYKR